LAGIVLIVLVTSFKQSTAAQQTFLQFAEEAVERSHVILTTSVQHCGGALMHSCHAIAKCDHNCAVRELKVLVQQLEALRYVTQEQLRYESGAAEDTAGGDAVGVVKSSSQTSVRTMCDINAKLVEVQRALRQALVQEERKLMDELWPSVHGWGCLAGIVANYRLRATLRANQAEHNDYIVECAMSPQQRLFRLRDEKVRIRDAHRSIEAHPSVSGDEADEPSTCEKDALLVVSERVVLLCVLVVRKVVLHHHCGIRAAIHIWGVALHSVLGDPAY
jgi:hypothetical protein